MLKGLTLGRWSEWRKMTKPPRPPSKHGGPCAEVHLMSAEPCLLGFQEPPAVEEPWRKWLDNWPELKEIQRAWHETFPLKGKVDAKGEDEV